MYEPPIHKLLTEIETNLRQQEENAVLQAVVSVGVNVDKEELIKALQYDRGQYEKGYADGCRDSRKQGRWIEDYETFVQDNGYESEPIHTGFVCSVCGRHSCSIEPYCHCGAKMDGGNEE